MTKAAYHDMPCPCDTCEREQECRSEAMACQAYACYMDPHSHWKAIKRGQINRTPTRARYAQIFNGKE